MQENLNWLVKLKQTQAEFANLPFSKLKLNKKEIGYLHNMAARKFKTGDFQGALAIFQLLVYLDGANITFIKSLASCYQNLNNFMEAFTLYNLAYVQNPENELACLFFIANCLIGMDNKFEATKALQDFIDKAPQDHEFIKAAKLLLLSLK